MTRRRLDGMMNDKGEDMRCNRQGRFYKKMKRLIVGQSGPCRQDSG